jgi:hypothetical protein
MNENAVDKWVIERRRQLQKKREAILALAPERALDQILDDPNALELVHSFPEQDFYFLIHDIGPEDSVPLLSLASNTQWEHIVDLDTWQKDRIDVKAVSRWLNLLLEADPKRFIRWFLEEKSEFVKFYLFKNLEVRIREHDQDPSEFGKDFFTLDDVYYLRLVETPLESKADKLTEEQRKEFITKFVEHLADHNHRAYQRVVLESTRLIPAETEEDCYRWRNVRLAEKGFLSFDEAVGIYQPMDPQDLKKQDRKHMTGSEEEAALLPVLQYPLKLLKEDNHFTRALTAIDSELVLPQVQTEFANLCNRIIVADHKIIRQREELGNIVRKACGYLNIGLERLAGEKRKVDVRRAADLVTQYPLIRIFRVGFGSALQLKWEAEKWLSQCWFARRGLRLSFWGEQWMGLLGGLLIKKPLFYDNYKTGVLYREFESLKDVEAAENVFNQIKAVDDLLALMAVNLDAPSSYGFLTYKNLILTLWARNYLGLATDKLRPLKLKQFIPFFEKLLPGIPDPAGEKSRTIPEAMKDHFINWLSETTGLKPYEITDRLGRIFEDLFEELASEYDRVATEDLDPRYILLFLLKRKKN